MFLLILLRSGTSEVIVFFTFHDVSINTFTDRYWNDMTENFTFHDVSINTIDHVNIDCGHFTLHSTMFLLILDLRTAPGVFLIFTFHDVSINTSNHQNRHILNFSLHSTMFLLILYITVISSIFLPLYIPRCFY